MGDDPRKTVKWMQQQLMEVEKPDSFGFEDEDLMARVDALLEDFQEEETPIGDFSRKSRGARAEQAHISQQFDPSAAVLTKTKKQLRREAKLQKKTNINRNIKGFVFLAILECIGILVLLGWWLQ